MEAAATMMATYRYCDRVSVSWHVWGARQPGRIVLAVAVAVSLRLDTHAACGCRWGSARVRCQAWALSVPRYHVRCL